MVHFANDLSESRLEAARQAAERALELAPDSPRVHLSIGYYHYLAHKDYDKALAEYAIAEEGLPGESEVFQAKGSVFRRQGRWEEARASFEEALALNPRDSELALDLAGTYKAMRRYADAVEVYDQSITFAPDQGLAYYWKASTLRAWKGTTGEARAVLESAANQDRLGLAWLEQEIAEGKYREALDRISSRPPGLTHGHLYTLLGEPDLAREAYEAARERIAERIRTGPVHAFFYKDLGLALAGLGRKEEAIREGKRAVELLPMSSDALNGAVLLTGLAQIYTMVGEHEAALDQLEYLLSIPSRVSIPGLRLWPWWAPLREHPRFKDLERRFGTPPS